jgi:hypothetical protein
MGLAHNLDLADYRNQIQAYKYRIIDFLQNNGVDRGHVLRYAGKIQRAKHLLKKGIKIFMGAVAESKALVGSEIMYYGIQIERVLEKSKSSLGETPGYMNAEELTTLADELIHIMRQYPAALPEDEKIQWRSEIIDTYVDNPNPPPFGVGDSDAPFFTARRRAYEEDHRFNRKAKED